MRKVMLLGIAGMLVLVAAATWAATVAQTRDGVAGTRIDTFELMMISKDLATQQYDTH